MENAMPGLEVGGNVGVRCKVQPGPFSDEHLVTIETVDGPISGFVNESEMKRVDQEWRVRGVVRAIKGDIIEVWIKGSFFTTNGLASVERQLALAA